MMQGIKRSAVLVGCLLMAACTSVPDLPHKPTLEIPASFSSAADGAAVRTPLDAQWWRQFGDERLNVLVEEVLAGNADLAQAKARIDEADAQVALSHAGRSLQLAVSPQVGRSKASSRSDQTVSIVSDGPASASALSSVSIKQNLYATSYLLPLQASYELDLWQRLSQAEEAAAQMMLASAEDYRAVRLVLAASTVGNYLLLRTHQAQLSLLEEQQVLHVGLLRNSKARLNSGLADGSALDTAQMNAAQVGRQLADLRKTIALDVHALEVLAGAMPGALHDLYAAKSPPNFTLSVPAELPASVLKKRPDVRRDEARLDAAFAQAAVARADYFPSLKLTTVLGKESAALDSLLQPGSTLWSLAAQISQPIFDGGRVRAGYALATARVDEAASAYQATVIQALREVEDALVIFDSMQDQMQSMQQVTQAARSSAQRLMQRAQAGLGNEDTANQARLSALQQQSAELDLNVQYGMAYVALRKALGE